MRHLSLCTGYGGLDQAAQAVLGGELAYVSDLDPGACKILAHRYPDVPNLGDLTVIDWASLGRIDVLTAGYPCQPFSHAGRRKGTDDDRHLWPYVREAIRVLRPRVTLLENVAGHRSLGFDRVLGDLAEDGMHVRWTSIRASDVGAPHRRERLFIVVTPDAAGNGWDEGRTESAGVVGGSDVAFGGLLPTPTARDHKGHNQRRDDTCLTGALLPTTSVADATGGHATRSGVRSNELLLPGVARAHAEGKLLPTTTTSDAKASGAADYDTGHAGTTLTDAAARQPERWGQYAAAIARWEALTRSAPVPTELGPKGSPRLSARFSEWMMGLPDGWITDAPGITRNEALKAAGNGVVPQQAAQALRLLLAMELAA